MAVLLFMATFWLVFAIVALESVLDFLGSLAGVLGLLTALIGSIVGIVRRKQEAVFTAGHRKSVSIVAGVVVVLAAVSTVLTFTSQETVLAAEAAGAVPVDMKDFEFVPKNLTATTGSATKFLVHNSDRGSHTFTVESARIDEIITPGSETLITFTPTQAGDVELTCVFHSDMKGTIKVS